MPEPGREMVYPYTFTQKLKYFPYRFYMKHNERFRMIPFAALVGMFIFYKIGNALNSPANIAKYEEYRRKEREEWAAHAEHLEGYGQGHH